MYESMCQCTAQRLRVLCRPFDAVQQRAELREESEQLAADMEENEMEDNMDEDEFDEPDVPAVDYA